MKILILNWRDPKHPLAGGAEKSVLEHAKYWQKKGAQITWFASSYPNSLKEEKIEGIQIIRAGNHYSVHLFFSLYALSRKFIGYDMIIDCFHFIPFFSPLFFPRTPKLALVQERAGKLWFKNISFPISLIGYLIEPLFFLLYRNTQFVTGSNSAAREISQMGINLKNIKVIHHGVDRKNSSVSKESDPTLLYLGLLTPDKGFQDAINAAIMVKNKIPSLILWVAGKEMRKGDFNRYVGKAKKFTKYFGFVNEQKKFDLYKGAWLLVHPSEKEGWGLTVIEAATLGTPTVGYNVAGLSDSVYNGKTGMLTQKDPKSLAETIVLLLTNKKKLNELGSNSLIWSKKFNWEESGKISWELISKIVKAQ